MSSQRADASVVAINSSGPTRTEAALYAICLDQPFGGFNAQSLVRASVSTVIDRSLLHLS